jgi:hypothetical protein
MLTNVKVNVERTSKLKGNTIRPAVLCNKCQVIVNIKRIPDMGKYISPIHTVYGRIGHSQLLNLVIKYIRGKAAGTNKGFLLILRTGINKS